DAVLDQIRPFLLESQAARLAAEIAVAQKDTDRFSEQLVLLCRAGESNDQALRTILPMGLEAGFDKTIDAILQKEVSSDACTAWAAEAFAERLAAAGQWRQLQSLVDRNVERPEIWNAVAVIYLNGLSEKRKWRRFRKFFKANRKRLKENDEAWGHVGYALLNFDRFKQGTDWLGDWGRRPGARPWMLLNYCLCLWYQMREKEALAVSREMVLREPDHATVCHEVLLGFQEAVAGRFDGARNWVSRIDPQGLSDYYRFIWLLTLAVLEMTPEVTDPSVQERFQSARQKWAEAHLTVPLAKQDQLLRRMAGKAAATLGRLRGGPAGLWFRIRQWFRL
ncbi:MAG: hypothetical protein R3236_07035, partial [Phycisphaeraceae bacterium]|nr:hypothetical protein [Phycisphaeraceae bacterium]